MELSFTKAFSPAHISLGFVPHIDEKNPLKTGSRGFGLCLSEGATAEAGRGNGILEYTLNGRRGDREFLVGFIKRVEAKLRRELPEKIPGLESLKVRTEVSFPLSQGYGMSASSLLSIALAIYAFLENEKFLSMGSKVNSLKFQERMREGFFSPETGKDASKIFRILIESVHEYEVEMLWGLGDVVGALRGGVEIRKEPGVPPHGRVEKVFLPDEGFLYTAVLGREIPTPDILRDRSGLEDIKVAYKEALKTLRGRMSPRKLFWAGEIFGKRSHLASVEILEAVERLKEVGFPSSPVMIGNTVCAYLPEERIDSIYRQLEGSHRRADRSWEGIIMEELKRLLDGVLEDFPLIFSKICRVDYMGARIVFTKDG